MLSGEIALKNSNYYYFKPVDVYTYNTHDMQMCRNQWLHIRTKHKTYKCVETIGCIYVQNTRRVPIENRACVAIYIIMYYVIYITICIQSHNVYIVVRLR